MHTIDLDSRTLSDAWLIAHGAYAPLTGFLGFDDAASVVERLTLTNGALFPIPPLLRTSETDLPLPNTTVALRWKGEVVAALRVSDVFAVPQQHWSREIFKTEDDAHPGVAAFRRAGEVAIGGTIEWLADRPREFNGLTPEETKAEIASRGWSTVVGFQTRNPIHRAHEHLLRTSLEIFDGVLLHPLVGDTRAEDVPAEVRLKCYEALLGNYLPASRVLFTTYDGWMRYGGPREAVLHAIVRRNFGATHFLVGRDHAGVGGYYGPFEAQQLLRGLPRQLLGIEPIFFDDIFYCRKCASMATGRTCAHGIEQRLALSGTEVRRRLREGEPLPAEFTRPEVAAVLREAFAAEVLE